MEEGGEKETQNDTASLEQQGQATNEGHTENSPGPTGQLVGELKTTLESAITDLEKGIDQRGLEERQNGTPPVQDDTNNNDNKENTPVSSTTGSGRGRQMVNGVNVGLHSRSASMASSSSSVTRGRARLRLPHEFKGRPGPRPTSLPPTEAMRLPELNLTGPPDARFMPQPKPPGGNEMVDFPFSQQQQQQQQLLMQNPMKTMNPDSPQIQKALRPPQDEDDAERTNSLKRRNPRQMYVDSSFYSPKHHPSVAEQVEMAHKLSSSLYDDGNKLSKGQEMYLKRAKKAQKWVHGAKGANGELPFNHRFSLQITPCGGDEPDMDEDEMPRHDKVPNLKLVMNPEGKLHDWTDLPREELPEMQILAAGGLSPDTAHHVVENLQACKGRGGELFAKRKKRADKWVVDEEHVCDSQPDKVADKFVREQARIQEQIIQEKEAELKRKMEEQQKQRETLQHQANAEPTPPFLQQQQQQQQQQYRQHHQQSWQSSSFKTTATHMSYQQQQHRGQECDGIQDNNSPNVPPPTPQSPPLPFAVPPMTFAPPPSSSTFAPKPAQEALPNFKPSRPRAPLVKEEVASAKVNQPKVSYNRNPYDQDRDSKVKVSFGQGSKKQESKFYEQVGHNRVEMHKAYVCPGAMEQPVMQAPQQVQQQQQQVQVQVQQQQQFVQQQQQQAPPPQQNNIPASMPAQQLPPQPPMQQQQHQQQQQPPSLPPHIAPCNLRPQSIFVPTFDKTIRNPAGIDVWANKQPRTWAQVKSSTLPRGHKTQDRGELMQQQQQQLLQQQPVVQQAVAQQPRMEEDVVQLQVDQLPVVQVVEQQQQQPQVQVQPAVQEPVMNDKPDEMEYDCSVKYVQQKNGEQAEPEHQAQPQQQDLIPPQEPQVPIQEEVVPVQQQPVEEFEPAQQMQPEQVQPVQLEQQAPQQEQEPAVMVNGVEHPPPMQEQIEQVSIPQHEAAMVEEQVAAPQEQVLVEQQMQPQEEMTMAPQEDHRVPVDEPVCVEQIVFNKLEDGDKQPEEVPFQQDQVPEQVEVNEQQPPVQEFQPAEPQPVVVDQQELVQEPIQQVTMEQQQVQPEPIQIQEQVPPQSQPVEDQQVQQPEQLVNGEQLLPAETVIDAPQEVPHDLQAAPQEQQAATQEQQTAPQDLQAAPQDLQAVPPQQQAQPVSEPPPVQPMFQHIQAPQPVFKSVKPVFQAQQKSPQAIFQQQKVVQPPFQTQQQQQQQQQPTFQPQQPQFAQPPPPQQQNNIVYQQHSSSSFQQQSSVSMQVKSGGFLHNGHAGQPVSEEQQLRQLGNFAEGLKHTPTGAAIRSGQDISHMPQQESAHDYRSTLRPTATGQMIRNQGEIVNAQESRQQEQHVESYTTSLRPTGLGEVIRSQGDIPNMMGGKPQQQAQPESYTTSLRSTGMGQAIRSQGDIPGMANRSQQQQAQPEGYTSTLRSTNMGQAIRETGSLPGPQRTASAGQVPFGQPPEAGVEEPQRRSVKNLVQKFRCIEDENVPSPQQGHRSPGVVRRMKHYHIQQQQQKQQRQHQQQQQQMHPPQPLPPMRSHEAPAAPVQQQQQQQDPMLQARNRSSMQACFSFDTLDNTFRSSAFGATGSSGSSGQPITDPSAILGAGAGNIAGGGKNLASILPEGGGLDIHFGGDTEKWDNHNAIARGWGNAEDKYKPVTFRKLYGVRNQ